MTRDDDVRRVLNGVRNLVRALRLSERDAERQHGISSAQMFVLHQIGANEGMSVREVADATATDQSSVSAVVKKLEDAGLITRSWSAEDARRAELRLTAKGRRLLQRSALTAQERLIMTVREFSPTRRRQLGQMLEQIVEGMGEQLSSPPMLFEDESTGGRKNRSGT